MPRSDGGRIVVIGASAGGVAALRTLLGALAPDYPYPVVVVLHTRETQIEGLVSLFARSCTLPVLEAQAGEPLAAGCVYLAPGDYHLLVERDRRFSMSVDDRVCYVRPSADVLFLSAADAYGRATIGVILTGTNDDGARGLAAIRSAGGIGLVQDPQEAEEPAMPEAAIKLAGADAVLPLHQLAERLHLERLT